MFCVDINVSIITPLFFSSLSFSFYHNSSKRPHNQAVDSGSPEALHGTASTSAPLDQNSWKNEQQEFAEGSDNKHWAPFPGPAPKGSYRWGHVKSLQAHLDFVLLINKLFKFSKLIRPLVYNHAFLIFFFFLLFWDSEGQRSNLHPPPSDVVWWESLWQQWGLGISWRIYAIFLYWFGLLHYKMYICFTWQIFASVADTRDDSSLVSFCVIFSRSCF